MRGDGTTDFNFSYIIMRGNAPRLYVYDGTCVKRWKNIESVIEYMRVSEDNPPSYAGLGIGARSFMNFRHNGQQFPHII